MTHVQPTGRGAALPRHELGGRGDEVIVTPNWPR